MSSGENLEVPVSSCPQLRMWWVHCHSKAETLGQGWEAAVSSPAGPWVNTGPNKGRRWGPGSRAYSRKRCVEHLLSGVQKWIRCQQWSSDSICLKPSLATVAHIVFLQKVPAFSRADRLNKCHRVILRVKGKPITYPGNICGKFQLQVSMQDSVQVPRNGAGTSQGFKLMPSFLVDGTLFCLVRQLPPLMSISALNVLICCPLHALRCVSWHRAVTHFSQCYIRTSWARCQLCDD